MTAHARPFHRRSVNPSSLTYTTGPDGSPQTLTWRPSDRFETWLFESRWLVEQTIPPAEVRL